MTTPTVPLPAAFYDAVLRQLARRPDGVRRRDLYELVADAMDLSPAQRAERLPSLTHLRYRHRIGWTLNLLKNAALIHSPAPTIWRLTDSGRRLIAEHPAPLGEDATRAITQAARAGVRGNEDIESDDEGSRDSGAQQPPEERIDAALGEMRATVARELLERIAQAPLRSSRNSCSTFFMPLATVPVRETSSTSVHPETAASTASFR